MVQFVYQFYQQKIEQWKRDKPEIFQQVVDKPEEIPEEVEQEQVEETMEEENKAEEEEEDEEEDELGFEKLTKDDTGKEDIAEEVAISSDEEEAVTEDK